MHALSFIVFALAAGGPSPAPTLPPAQHCGIEVVTTAHGIALRPFARFRTNVSGIYQLTVNTSGPAGQAAVSQGGDFTVREGRSDGFGSVNLGRSPGFLVEARMNLSWDGGQTECARQFRM